ncbi:MAG: hypothetical protein NZ551_06055 [Microscillaceae bacterium]|nr:hypothetical protein [Microscillaceae bacterium]MDW8460757.1 hypothetical protein [Cytophagales bacterium]
MDRTTKIALYIIVGIIGIGVIYWIFKKLVAIALLVLVFYLIYRFGFAKSKVKN